MKREKWNEGLNYIDEDLVKEFVCKEEAIEERKRKRSVWLRFGALAACFCLIVSAVVTVFPKLQSKTPGADISFERELTPSDAPGISGDFQGVGAGVEAELSSAGISVTATLVETLLDTYTFFDDGEQNEFCLLRMKTVSLLKGQKMTEGFYYLVPADFMIDFSLYDRFVIIDMAQFGYEYSVMYNKTQKSAERLDLVLFGYRTYGYTLMGENFMAFDAHGNFDERLWKGNERWADAIRNSTHADTLREAEATARAGEGPKFCVQSLKGITGEAADALARITSFENGIYVPYTYSTMLNTSSEFHFGAVRYLNGFATNEEVWISCGDPVSGREWRVTVTKARFDEPEADGLPDLPAAFAALSAAYDRGEITPTHKTNLAQSELFFHEIFGWYAMTDQGVVGIIRIKWRYIGGINSRIDDAYYIVENGSAGYTSISRDRLLERIGSYETTYIYKGEYDENGRCQVPWCMMGEKRYFFPPVCKKIKNFAKPIDKGRNA